MSFFEKEYWYLLWVLLVGLIGGILGLLDENGKPRNRRTVRALLAGVLTAMFLCWVTFAIVNHFMHDLQLSLAVGGIIAFMGGDWVRRKIDKAANKKIDGLSKDRDSYEGWAKSEYEEDLK